MSLKNLTREATTRNGRDTYLLRTAQGKELEAFSRFAGRAERQDFHRLGCQQDRRRLQGLRAIASRGVLSREEVAKECGFAKSALDQNPRIKDALRELECDLRLRGILPPVVERKRATPQELPMREPGWIRGAQDAERLRRLVQENAGLKAEVSELRRPVEKYAVLRDALAITGRLPR